MEFAPEFKTPLSACTVAEGETAVFECAVTGTSPIIRWLKDGKELKPSPHVVIESKPDGTHKLVVKDAAAADIGKYEVEASTAGGKAKSDAQLDVKGKLSYKSCSGYYENSYVFSSKGNASGRLRKIGARIRGCNSCCSGDGGPTGCIRMSRSRSARANCEMVRA